MMDTFSPDITSSLEIKKIIQYDKKGKIHTRCKVKNNTLGYFGITVLFLSVISFFYLNIDWIKIFSRLPSIGRIFWELIHLNFSKMDFIFDAFIETIAIALLSTIYSLILGLIFGMIAAENIFKKPWLSSLVKSFFTFLRAIPTPVWVLLMLVSLGFGPAAGIAGLCVHTTAFFTRAFSQSFEDIPDEIIEALEATGASKIKIFTNAVLPSSIGQIVAWVGMRFEINFAECAILGMVGAGGIGFVISSSIQNYEFGVAGTAILLVFLFAYSIERIFIKMKNIAK